MADAVAATLTASEQAHLIEQRHEVRDKFNDALYRLEIIKRLGEPSFGSNPEQYLKKMRLDDATFNTDIPAELKRIELMLREQRLEQQWKKDGRGQDEADEQAAMQEWIAEQLNEGAAAEIQLRLPYKVKLNKFAEPSHLNDDYEAELLARAMKAKKGPGDRVMYDGRTAMVLQVRREVCTIRWDRQTDGQGETAEIPEKELQLLSKAHPALTITAAASRAVSLRNPRSVRRNTASSTLEALFSAADEGDVSRPKFLQPPEKSRAAQVAREQQARRAKMMAPPAGARRASGGVSPRVSTKRIEGRPGVQSKFRQKPPFAQSVSQERVVTKEPGVPLGLVFDPETLCLLDVEATSPCSGFEQLRGMRITHVSTRADFDGSFATDEGVHSKEQLRKVEARAVGAATVAMQFDTWTQRRVVEKKKREFTEKLMAPPKSARGGRNTPRG